MFLDFHVKTGTRISLRDKRLFEISEVEIARVNCIFVSLVCILCGVRRSLCALGVIGSLWSAIVAHSVHLYYFSVLIIAEILRKFTLAWFAILCTVE